MQDFQTEITQLQRLLRQDLRLRGATLAAQIKYARRLLPRDVNKALRRLADAETMVAVPKLAKQLDWDQLAQDYALCLRHMQRHAQGRVHPLWLRAASWAALVVFLLGLGSLGQMALRGGF